MCTLGTLSGRYLFKTRDLWLNSDRTEEIVHGQGRYRYVGVQGQAAPGERGLNSGINTAGVAVAITHVDYIPLAEALETRTPRGVLVEEILSTCGDLSAALRVMTDYLDRPLVGGTITVLTPSGGVVLEQIHPRFAFELLQEPITVRTNHFLNLQVPGKLIGNRDSSCKRYGRMMNLLWQNEPDIGTDLETIRNILADHKGEYPICSHGGELVTVSAVIYDLRLRTLHYHKGNPCSFDWNSHAL